MKVLLVANQKYCDEIKKFCSKNKVFFVLEVLLVINTF
jgi:hypothetical protein